MIPTQLWRQIKAYTERRLSTVRVAALIKLGALVDAGGAWSTEATGDLGERPSVELLQHYGLRTSAPGGRAIVVQVGGRGGRWVGVAELDTDAPSPEVGEVILYAASGARITLTAEGDVLIDPAAGRQVILQGGTAAVGRVGDAVTPDAGFTAWLGAAATALNSLAGVPAPTSIGSTITSGNTRVVA